MHDVLDQLHISEKMLMKFVISFDVTSGVLRNLDYAVDFQRRLPLR